VGRDSYGVFPLKGKLLNVRDAPTNQVLKNEEIQNLIKIVGLNPSQKYDSPEQRKQLRYGHIMLMTD
jgi:DNA topoisomerase II